MTALCQCGHENKWHNNLGCCAEDLTRDDATCACLKTTATPDEAGQMWQTAPYPHHLIEVVDKVTYNDWSLNVDVYEREVGGEGLTLRIRFPAPDHCDPQGAVVFLIHDFEVPSRLLDKESWQRWVFDCIMLAHRHEAMEDFRIDGEQIFFPAHDAMNDMYETKHVAHRRKIG